MGNIQEDKKSIGRFLLPAVMLGIGVTQLASGGGFERICVPISETEVQCVPTTKVEKYLSSVGMQSLKMPDQNGQNSLLVCDKGMTYPITVQGDGSTPRFFVADMPSICAPPVIPSDVTKLYGPQGETGGSFCSGRTSPDNCKDCCLAVGLAQAGMVAAAGKMFRDTKPTNKWLYAADAVVELSSYGLIYWNRHKCNGNCEVSYEINERRLK